MTTLNEVNYDAIDLNHLTDFLSEELGGDKVIFLKLLDIFKGYMAEINNLDAEVSLEVIQKLAHKVRSSSSSFGALKLANSLEALELLCNNQKKDEVGDGLKIVQNLAQKSLKEIIIFTDKN